MLRSQGKRVLRRFRDLRRFQEILPFRRKWKASSRRVNELHRAAPRLKKKKRQKSVEMEDIEKDQNQWKVMICADVADLRK